MKIGVSLIALNESNYLARCMHSCGFADIVAMVDGGSEDSSQDVAFAALQSVNPGCEWLMKVVEWGNDFGAQRQHSYDLLMHGEQQGYEPPDWWMRIDSDEAYGGQYRRGIRSLLEQLPQHIMAVRVRQTNLYPDPAHYVANIGGWETWPRIFRRGQDYRWVGRVHEHVQIMTRNGLEDIPESCIVTWNADVLHYGWLDKRRRAEREDLYAQIPGSGVAKRGDLTQRDYHIRTVPQ